MVRRNFPFLLKREIRPTRLGSVTSVWLSATVKELHDEVVEPIAVKKTRGAWYKSWKLVSLDGSTMAVADTKENQEAFGRPGASRGSSAYPQIRFVSFVENGTHVLFGTEMAGYLTGEITLTKSALQRHRSGL